MKRVFEADSFRDYPKKSDAYHFGTDIRTGSATSRQLASFNIFLLEHQLARSTEFL